MNLNGFACLVFSGLAICCIKCRCVEAQVPDGQGLGQSSKSSVEHVVGIDKRVPWTTSRVTGSPEPPLPFLTERSFPALQFNNPIDIALAPGSKRLFVVEQAGKIYSFPDHQQTSQLDLAIDVAREIPGIKEVYAITFHPDFVRNRYVYLCCIREAELEDGTRVSRFRVTDTDPPKIDASSEHIIITWLSGGHNGCCLKFGLDGCLYISTGDGVGPNPPDTRRTGQDISDLLSAILRIDVDHAESGRNYRIPADNPFVTTSGARPEVWAYGFRNPWRMGFDRKTGDLWVGDVGWELWELLYRVERGGNYGWGVMEGRQPTNPEWPRGPTPILPPTVDHPHSESSSITGGLTYYGNRLPELVGAHIYGDYDTGKIWGLQWENGRIAWHRELADTTLRIVGFGEDTSGELLLLDHVGGSIQRLIPNPDNTQLSAFPRKLSETGLFASAAEQVPAAGVIPYSITSAMWDDGAQAERFVALPGDSRIKTNGNAWQFPQGAVLVKTLSIETRNGDAVTQRKLETQLLHFTGTEWQCYSYEWNSQQTDADLVGANGADRRIDLGGATGPGGSQHYSRRLAGRAECKRCHNPWSGSVLAFNPPQLNKRHDFGRRAASQLDTLNNLGLLDPPVPSSASPLLANPRDPSADLMARARSYLHANCAHCHRMHAGSSVLSQMQYDLPLEKTNMVGVRPTLGTFGIHAAHVISPGDPTRSVLLYRMAKLGGGRMPHIGAQTVDQHGVDLIYRWIESLNDEHSQDSAGKDAAAKLRADNRRLLDQLQQDRTANVEAMSDAAAKLLSTTSGALLLLRAIDEGGLPQPMVSLVVELAAAKDDGTIRDLFERFLPEEKRVKRLGSVIRPEDILRLTGDSQRGRQVFFGTSGGQCKNCHRLENEGREIGPDLSQIGQKQDRGQLLESILAPSKRIDPKYVTYLAETHDGRLFTGLLVKKDANELVLRDAQDNLISISNAQLERFGGESSSLMPELLLRDLTAQQVADLLEYLSSLR